MDIKVKDKDNKKTRIIIKILTLSLISILILSFMYFTGGCKKNTGEETPAATVVETTAEQTTESLEETTAESIMESATEPEEEIPREITGLLQDADNYYLNGEYGLARSTYRKAEIAITDSTLSDKKKQELIDSFYPKYEKAKEIVDLASLHYANAMQLIYETKFEQALEELESALELYPGYDEAQEAYENLKTLMGLQ